MVSRTGHKPIPSDYVTYGRTHAVRHPDCDYANDIDMHLTICAESGRPFTHAPVAEMVCANVDHYSRKLGYRLYGYCAMPDHLHVLLSPADSRIPVSRWLREYKSFTTRAYQKMTGNASLWQRSAHDHVCREAEVAEKVLTYIVNNPVRAGLVEDWSDWPWARAYIEL